MAEPEVFDWDEWEHGKTYKLSNDELVGALLSEVSALRQRGKALEERQADCSAGADLSQNEPAVRGGVSPRARQGPALLEEEVEVALPRVADGPVDLEG